MQESEKRRVWQDPLFCFFCRFCFCLGFGRFRLRWGGLKSHLVSPNPSFLFLLLFSRALKGRFTAILENFHLVSFASSWSIPFETLLVLSSQSFFLHLPFPSLFVSFSKSLPETPPFQTQFALIFCCFLLLFFLFASCCCSFDKNILLMFRAATTLVLRPLFSKVWQGGYFSGCPIWPFSSVLLWKHYFYCGFRVQQILTTKAIWKVRFWTRLSVRFWITFW